jgi:hypothetical protein
MIVQNNQLAINLLRLQDDFIEIQSNVTSINHFFYELIECHDEDAKSIFQNIIGNNLAELKLRLLEYKAIIDNSNELS